MMKTEVQEGQLAARTIQPGDRLAAIDIGSNSVRLMVVELLAGGQYRVLDEERETTRLAREMAVSGVLGRTSIDATLAGLGRFQQIAAGLGVRQLRTIATCAVREAKNGDEFRRRALDELDLEIDVISPWQEAELTFLSVQRAFDLSDRNVAIADLGGGSTEVIFASGNHIDEIVATPLGAVRLSELYQAPGGLFGDDYQLLLDEIDRRLKVKLPKPPFIPQVLFGTGGTFTNMAAMLIAAKGDSSQRIWGYRATRADVRHLLDRLAALTVKQRRDFPGLTSDRADIIVAGLAVIDCLLRRLKVNIVQVHDGGVRDGVILKMIDRLRPEAEAAESRAAALLRFARSCGVDLQHTQHVAVLCVQLFDQLAGPFQLNAGDRPLLEAAALLQDVGYLINYEQHHKHSYHLIVNSRLPGFRRAELEIIANVARYHRGSNPKEKHDNFRTLSPEEQQRVRQLAGILRLAGGLDRSYRQHVRGLDTQVADGRTTIWVDAGDDSDVDLWSARTRAGLFEKAFSTQVAIRPRIAV